MGKAFPRKAQVWQEHYPHCHECHSNCSNAIEGQCNWNQGNERPTIRFVHHTDMFVALPRNDHAEHLDGATIEVAHFL